MACRWPRTAQDAQILASDSSHRIRAPSKETLLRIDACSSSKPGGCCQLGNIAACPKPAACGVEVANMVGYTWTAGHLLHDNAEGDPAAARALGQVELAPKEQRLQVVGPLLLLHQVVQREVPLVLPHQPQRLLCNRSHSISLAPLQQAPTIQTAILFTSLEHFGKLLV